MPIQFIKIYPDSSLNQCTQVQVQQIQNPISYYY